jgi:hypothetical protein
MTSPYQIYPGLLCDSIRQTQVAALRNWERGVGTMDVPGMRDYLEQRLPELAERFLNEVFTARKGLLTVLVLKIISDWEGSVSHEKIC